MNSNMIKFEDGYYGLKYLTTNLYMKEDLRTGKSIDIDIDLYYFIEEAIKLSEGLFDKFKLKSNSEVIQYCNYIKYDSEVGKYFFKVVDISSIEQKERNVFLNAEEMETLKRIVYLLSY